MVPHEEREDVVAVVDHSERWPVPEGSGDALRLDVHGSMVVVGYSSAARGTSCKGVRHHSGETMGKRRPVTSVGTIRMNRPF